MSWLYAIPAAVAAALFSAILIGVARRLDWVDRVEGAEHRKLRRTPVPLTGGAAMLLGALVGLAFVPGIDDDGRLARGWESARAGVELLAWPGLLAAFALGWIDDLLRGGLPAWAKLAGQGFVALCVVAFPGQLFAGDPLLTRIWLGAWAIVCMNAVNTYDHADGLAGSLGLLALLGPAPVLAGAVGGTLPFNTFLRQRPHVDTRERAPRAMMGDSGSHWLGVAIATTPAAAWLLVVPLFDLMRVAAGRIARGQPFWEGDRTHIGHRLEGLGLRPTRVALLMAIVVAPPFLVQLVTDSPGGLIAGLLASAGLYLVILVVTEQTDPSDAQAFDLQEETELPDDTIPGIPPRRPTLTRGVGSAGPGEDPGTGTAMGSGERQDDPGDLSPGPSEGPPPAPESGLENPDAPFGTSTARERKLGLLDVDQKELASRDEASGGPFAG